MSGNQKLLEMPQREVVKAIAQQLMALDREAWRLFLNGAAGGPEGEVLLAIGDAEIAVRVRIPPAVAIAMAMWGSSMRPPDSPVETERERLEWRRREFASAPGALAYTDHPAIEPAGWEVRTTDR